MKPHIVLASLLVALTGMAPAGSACGNLDERCTYPDASTGPIGIGEAVDCALVSPGAPGGGIVGAAEWFAKAAAYATCGYAATEQDSVLQHGGDVGWKAGTVAAGGAGLVGAEPTGPAGAYQAALIQVALSQAHDTCAVGLGGLCGPDAPVDETQRCPSGLAVPNPVPGSLTGDTLDNSNGALQSTCSFADAADPTLPTPGQAGDYAGSSLGTLSGLGDDVFAIASETFQATCVLLTGSTPCV